MNKTIKILSVLLAAQVALVAGLWLNDLGANEEAPIATLLDVDFKQVDNIVIEGDGKTAVLAKSAAGWALPEHGDLPATEDKVADFLDKLKGLKGGWPVATTGNAAERFEVGEANAQRRIILKKGDSQLGALLVGTSPGFRKVHVRLPGKPEIYAVTFAQYDAPADSGDWLDKSLLRFGGTVNKVRVWGVEATREGDGEEAGWALSQLPEGHRVDSGAIDRWLEYFTGLNVSGLVDEVTATSIQAGEPALVAMLSDGNQSTEYQVYRQDDKSYIKSSANPQLFEIPDYTGKAIAGAKEEGFSVATKSEEDTETAEAGVGTK